MEIIANGFCAQPVNDEATRWYIKANPGAADRYAIVTGHHFQDGVRVGAAAEIRAALDACVDGNFPLREMARETPIATDFPGVEPALAALSLGDPMRNTRIAPCRNWGWGRCENFTVIPKWRVSSDDLCPECAYKFYARQD